MKRTGECLDCKEQKQIFGIERCRNCYSRYKESLAPEIKCQCNPDCKTMIPAYDESGNPRKYAYRHQLLGDKNPNWNGGRFIGSMGYWLVYKPDHHLADLDGYVLEHRLVYEEYYKCSLLPSAIIHHKNKIKTDNRPENLEVWNRKEHQNIHMIKDMSDRKCSNCNSSQTYVYKKTGWSNWYVDPETGGWLCNKCRWRDVYYKNNKKLLRQRRDTQKVGARRSNILDRICSGCGIDKSETKTGQSTWYIPFKEEEYYVCNSCYGKFIRVRKSAPT